MLVIPPSYIPNISADKENYRELFFETYIRLTEIQVVEMFFKKIR